MTLEYVRLVFYDDGGGVRVPASYDLQAFTGGAWASVPGQTRTPAVPSANATTEISFPPLTTTQLRIVAPNAGGTAKAGWGLSEFWVRSKPVFNVVNVNSNLLLAVENASQDAGTQVQQFHGSGTADQLWELVGAGGGYCKIVNVGSGLVLAPAGGSAADSAPMQQVADSSGAATLWTLIDPTASGQCKIKNAASGLLLGVSSEATTDSANVVQFDDNGTPDHLWLLEAAAAPELAFDDFEDGAATQWTAESGAWAPCTAGASREYCATAAGDGLALTGQASWRSYTLDALVRPSAAAEGTSIGLVARAADAAHYYAAEITRNADGTLGWALSKNDGGTRTSLARGFYAWAASPAASPPAQVALRFSVPGGFLTMGIVARRRGRCRRSGSVFDAQLVSGQAGAADANGLSASFDAVRADDGGVERGRRAPRIGFGGAVPPLPRARFPVAIGEPPVERPRRASVGRRRQTRLRPPARSVRASRARERARSRSPFVSISARARANFARAMSHGKTRRGRVSDRSSGARASAAFFDPRSASPRQRSASQS